MPAFAAATPLRASAPSSSSARTALSSQRPPTASASSSASALPSPSPAPTTAPAPASDAPLLLRAARGEDVERPPVWLMRQAGRYMAEFRAYSDKVPFRVRSESPEIAFELSMQPYRAFRTDGVIMFSDILTPLPALGVEFDITPGKGPVFPQPIRTEAQAAAIAAAVFDPTTALPFVATLLDSLAAELADQPTTLLGFVGAPFTLAAYAIEGAGCKNLVETKRMMYGTGGASEAVLQTVLNSFADMAGAYAVFQIDHGAQVVQFFDSWAHHLSPAQYRKYALPAAKRSLAYVKKHRPDTPVVFFANGSAGKLEDIVTALRDDIDVLQLDWSVSMADARRRLGNDLVLQGNVDPTILLSGNEQAIRNAVRECVAEAGPRSHILNLGHGVIKETPEVAVAVFCDEVRRCIY
jgi:uroporphyrinogen decarboxylase